MTLSLVLVDDWELRGDGSGDMRRIQFDAMRKLNRIYEDHGLKGSYNAEIMQQLHHLRLGEQHAELKELAQEWEEIVLETYKHGHDVQLHVHSQWSDASYQDGRWKLAGDWAIINHSRAGMVRMISQSREYLEKLIRRVDPKYRCISFRAGAWAIAPNEHILPVLAEQGIVFDMSICGGIKYDNTVVKLDYTDCEETFLPFYPYKSDARRVGNAETGIVCVPTFSFRPSRAALLKGDVKHIHKRLHSRLSKPKSTSAAPTQSQPAGTSYTVWQDDKGKVAKLWELSKDHLLPEIRVSDLSHLSFDLLKDMVSAMRGIARRRNLASVPVILENHSKNISNFDDIKRFAEYVSGQTDLEVITLTELSRRLEAGLYPVVGSEAVSPAVTPAVRRASGRADGARVGRRWRGRLDWPVSIEMIEAIACGLLGYLHPMPSNGRLGNFSVVASRTTKAERFPLAGFEARNHPEVLRVLRDPRVPGVATQMLMRRRPNISEALTPNLVCKLCKPRAMQGRKP